MGGQGPEDGQGTQVRGLTLQSVKLGSGGYTGPEPGQVLLRLGGTVHGDRHLPRQDWGAGGAGTQEEDQEEILQEQQGSVEAADLRQWKMQVNKVMLL